MASHVLTGLLSTRLELPTNTTAYQIWRVIAADESDHGLPDDKYHRMIEDHPGGPSEMASHVLTGLLLTRLELLYTHTLKHQTCVMKDIDRTANTQNANKHSHEKITNYLHACMSLKNKK